MDLAKFTKLCSDPEIFYLLEQLVNVTYAANKVLLDSAVFPDVDGYQVPHNLRPLADALSQIELDHFT